MTQAARALNLAQSAASHAVAALESRHNTRLFDRIGRRIELTEAGRSLLAEARAILAQVARAELALGEFGQLQRGTLAVRASQTIASYWLPYHLVRFRRAYPAIDIRLKIGNTAQVADAIETAEAELGFVEGAVTSAHLTSTAVARDQMLVVVAPGHPWADAPLAANALVGGDWVLREQGSGTRSAFEQALAQLGVAPQRLNVVLELPSNEAVRAAVEAGLGATALSASVAAPSLEAGLLRKVAFPLRDREFHSLRHKNRDPSRIAAAFLALMAATRPQRPVPDGFPSG